MKVTERTAKVKAQLELDPRDIPSTIQLRVEHIQSELEEPSTSHHGTIIEKYVEPTLEIKQEPVEFYEL